MTPPRPSQPNGAVGRADLLRGLAVGYCAPLALEWDAEGWFGYIPRREKEGPGGEEPVTLDLGPFPRGSASPTLEPPDRQRPPLRMPWALAVLEQSERPPVEGEAVRDDTDLKPLDTETAAPMASRRLIDFEDLVPWARLLPAVRRSLGAFGERGVDEGRLADLLAQYRFPSRLPPRRVRRWPSPLVVVLDFSPRLWPFRTDMHRLAGLLLKHCGHGAVSLRVFNHGPDGGWSDWCAHQKPDAWINDPPIVPWIMPPAGTSVLVVSDLGLSSSPATIEATAWGRFVRALRRARGRSLALAPVGARQLPACLTREVPVLRWSPDAPPHPKRGRGEVLGPPVGLEDLLAMVAAARRVDPPLLRALRALNPQAPLNAGLEGAVWDHADVAAGFAASLRPECQEAPLQRFRALPLELRDRVFEVIRHHHAHLPAILTHEEALLWQANCPEAEPPPPAREALIKNARRFFERLALTLPVAEGERAPGDWLGVAAAILHRTDPGMRKTYGPELARVAAGIAKVKGKRAVPAWVDPALLAAARSPEASVSAWVVHDVARGVLRLQRDPPGFRQRPLGSPLTVDSGGVRIRQEQAFRRVWIQELPAVLPFPVPSLSGLEVETSTGRLVIAAVERPRRVASWRCDRDGVVVEAPPLAGGSVEWDEEGLAVLHRASGRVEDEGIVWARGDGKSLRAVAQRTVQLEGDYDQFFGINPAGGFAGHPNVRIAKGDGVRIAGGEENIPTGWVRSGQLRFGLDRSFGVFADLHISTETGQADQRFRWIEPGQFLMGSPDDELGRDSNEGPQHWVSLTQGFWLADTACPQALWQAVMGDNPSKFKGPDRPVEQVSWTDVQGFLRRLEALVPGCGADLPTEAEWEYACRAGTQTPFNLGTSLGSDQASFDGAFPSGGAPKGVYRKETVPVRSFLPNAWGLYEMHGNVWEWCADGRREYGGQPVVDPRGPEESEAPRVQRGGSWLDNASFARSAFRDAARPGYASGPQGFRLCLRSIKSSLDKDRPGGPVGGAPGGRSPAPPRDEVAPGNAPAGKRLSLLRRLRQRLWEK